MLTEVSVFCAVLVVESVFELALLLAPLGTPLAVELLLADIIDQFWAQKFDKIDNPDYYTAGVCGWIVSYCLGAALFRLCSETVMVA